MIIIIKHLIRSQLDKWSYMRNENILNLTGRNIINSLLKLLWNDSIFFKKKALIKWFIKQSTLTIYSIEITFENCFLVPPAWYCTDSSTYSVESFFSFIYIFPQQSFWPKQSKTNEELSFSLFLIIWIWTPFIKIPITKPDRIVSKCPLCDPAPLKVKYTITPCNQGSRIDVFPLFCQLLKQFV